MIIKNTSQCLGSVLLCSGTRCSRFILSKRREEKNCSVAPTRRLSLMIINDDDDAVAAAVAVVVASVIIELCLVGRYHRNSHVKADAIRIQIEIKILALRLFGSSQCKIT